MKKHLLPTAFFIVWTLMCLPWTAVYTTIPLMCILGTACSFHLSTQWKTDRETRITTTPTIIGYVTGLVLGYINPLKTNPEEWMIASVVVGIVSGGGIGIVAHAFRLREEEITNKSFLAQTYLALCLTVCFALSYGIHSVFAGILYHLVFLAAAFVGQNKKMVEKAAKISAHLLPLLSTTKTENI